MNLPNLLRLLSLVPVALLSGCASAPILQKPIENAPPIRSAVFRQTAGHLLGAPFTGGNRLTTLSNGDEIFPAMLGAILSAKQTVTFETFVFEKGDVPAAFVAALVDRARAGVKVHVILDAHGAKKSRKYHRELRQAGVELEIFHPIFWPDPRRYNNRTHRKILVVDGKVGFIGGVGIADDWAGRASSPEEWRDLHYRVEGPAVAQLQGAFVANWIETRHELLTGPGYFPPLAPAGPVDAALFYGAPRHGRYAVPLMYLLAISCARESLLIANAYFVPDREMLDALVAAAQRGVKVRIILPGEHMDQKAVRRAARKRYPRLLEAGVEIYEYHPTMMHTKLLIADGHFVSIGSSNFDSRSMRLNDEANLDILNAGFAAEQTRIFERDRAAATRVTEEEHQKKALTEKPTQAVQAPVEGQL